MMERRGLLMVVVTTDEVVVVMSHAIAGGKMSPWAVKEEVVVKDRQLQGAPLSWAT